MPPFLACGTPIRSSILLAPLIPVAGLEGGAEGGPDGTPESPASLADPTVDFMAGEELCD